MKTNNLIKNNKLKILSRVLLSASGVFRNIFIAFLGLLVNYILLHNKQDVVLDTYVFCITAVNVLFIFSNLGGKEYVIFTLSKEQFRISKISREIISNRLIFSTAIGCLVLFFPFEIGIKCFLALYVFIKTFSLFFDGLTVVLKQFYQVVFFDTLTAIVFILVVYFDGNTSNALIFLYELLVFELVKLLIYMYLFRNYFSLKLSLTDAINVAKKSFPFFLLSLSGFVCSKIDLYVVCTILSKAETSVYFIILNLVTFCQVTYASIIGTYSSNIYRLSRTSFNKFKKVSLYFSLIFSILSALATYIICVFYYGVDFDLVFAFLVLVNILVFGFVMLNVMHYNKTNLQRYLPVIFFLSGLLNFLLSILFTKIFGIKGAFLSSTLSALFSLYLLDKFRESKTDKISYI